MAVIHSTLYTADHQIPGVSVYTWRWGASLTRSIVTLLALVWSVPFAVLLVGTPIAVAIVLLLWLGRLTLGAF